MRVFLSIVAMFILVAVGVSLISSDRDILIEVWVAVIVTIIAVAVSLLIGRKKK